MKYIIMCGGYASNKPLRVMYGETLVERTIRLLKANGIHDIAISTNNAAYEAIGVPILSHENKGQWLNAFYPSNVPSCYLYGDVLYSPNAIKTIVKTKTDSIEFFASSPPYDERYTKLWAEPFAFKAQDIELFHECVRKTIKIKERFDRMPISWELWQVIKKTPLNRIDYKNYIAINDYTVDIDSDEQAQLIIDRGYGKRRGPRKKGRGL